MIKKFKIIRIVAYILLIILMIASTVLLFHFKDYHYMIGISVSLFCIVLLHFLIKRSEYKTDPVLYYALSGLPSNKKSRAVFHYKFWKEQKPFEFEENIAILYSKIGYKVQITSKTGDGGVDIIAQKNYETFAIQCKLYSTPVGPQHLRELNGVVCNPANKFSKGLLITSNKFTENTIKEAKGTKVHLVDIRDLVRLSMKYKLL